jgi:hypothetical protein
MYQHRQAIQRNRAVPENTKGGFTVHKLMMVAVLSVLVLATTLAVSSGIAYQPKPLQTAGDVGPGGD